MPSEIILVSSNSQDAIFVNSLATSCSSHAIQSSQIGDVSKEIEAGQFLAFFFEVQNLADLTDIVAFCSESTPLNKIHIILTEEALTKLDEILQSSPFSNFLIRKFDDGANSPDICGRHYARLVLSSSSEATGLHDLFQNQSEISVRKITDSLQKRFVAEGFAAHLEKKKWNAKIASVFANALDELIMNAIFDAQLGSDRQQPYAATSRGASVQLADDKAIEVQFGFDGPYVGIAVIDKVGTLNRNKFFQDIAKGFGAVQTANRGAQTQEAGSELALIMKAGCSIYCGSVPGTRTFFAVIARKTDTFVEFKNQFQFICTRFE
jgi:hypothetical protein